MNKGEIVAICFIIFAVIAIIGMIWYEVLNIPRIGYQKGRFKIYYRTGHYSARMYTGKLFWIFPIWVDIRSVCSDSLSDKYWISKEKLINYLEQKHKESLKDDSNLVEEINFNKRGE